VEAIVKEITPYSENVTVSVRLQCMCP